MIRFCLYLRHQSSKAYDTLRESDVIQLPSQDTLRDYSHAAEPGFSYEVDDQLNNVDWQYRGPADFNHTAVCSNMGITCH